MPKPKRLLFPPFDARGIPLAELIELHEKFPAPGTVPENLGDSFLYATNPVFRSVRDEYLRLGFSFTTEDYCNYFAFPLMSLDDVIAAGKIPYRPNFVWLKKLALAVPGLLTLTELKRSDLQFNYLFHESAHLIAHRRLFGTVVPAKTPKNADTLLRILVGEAFANTTECMSFLFAEGEIATYFLDANCHFRADALTRKALLSARKRFGLPATARVLLAAFLYSNFMYQKLGAVEEKRIRAFAGLPPRSDVRALLRIGLSLCDEFRSTTTHLHLVKLGFPVKIAKLTARDPLLALAAQPELRAQVHGLADLLSENGS